jgi:hypothetical protein
VAATTLAQRSYAVLVEVLEDIGDLEPGHGLRAADRAVAERFGVSLATARNWRRGRQHHVSFRIGEHLLGAVAALAPRHLERLRLQHDLAHRLERIDRIAERLAGELAGHMGEGTSWHIYSGPLVLAFAPGLDPARRADLAARATQVIDRIGELGFDHRDVPALPELVRAMLHLWHHAGTFGVRGRSVQASLARAGASYLNRIELALYFGDVCAMASLFTGDLAAADRYSARARSLLATADAADEAASPVPRREAETMVAAVRAQILACHGGDEAMEELDAFAAGPGDLPATCAWIDSVRYGALGYLAAGRFADRAAGEHFQMACERSDAWLRAFGIAFGSTPHRALAACARFRAGAPLEACLAWVYRALHDAQQHAVVVDRVAALRAAEALHHAEGDELRASHHRRRAEAEVASHGLEAWDGVLRGRLARVT